MMVEDFMVAANNAVDEVKAACDYTTKANNNYYPDNEPVVVEQMIGKLELQINSLGTIIKILQSKITTLIIIILLILKFAYNKFTYKTKVRRRKKKIT